MRWLKQFILNRIPRHVRQPSGTPEQREALDRVSEPERPPSLADWCARRYPRR